MNDYKYWAFFHDTSDQLAIFYVMNWVVQPIVYIKLK